MRLLFRLTLIAGVLLALAKPATASPITVLVGDKDWFGTSLGSVPGVDLGPWDDTQLWDWRSPAEQGATSGAQLTDIYSALFPYPVDSGCSPVGDPGCTPNGASGFVSIPFSGVLQSGSITILMGGFQCSQWGPITVDINGANVPFCFSDGEFTTALRTFTLTPTMLAAANSLGEVRINLDDTAAQFECLGACGIDYFAFDYFELNGDVAHAPEPATFVLLGLGLAGLAARRRLRTSTGRP